MNGASRTQELRTEPRGASLSKGKQLGVGRTRAVTILKLKKVLEDTGGHGGRGEKREEDVVSGSTGLGKTKRPAWPASPAAGGFAEQ